MIAVNIDSEISLISPLIFTGLLKLQNLAFEPLKFRNETTYQTSKINLGSANNGHLMSPDLI